MYYQYYYRSEQSCSPHFGRCDLFTIITGTNINVTLNGEFYLNHHNFNQDYACFYFLSQHKANGVVLFSLLTFKIRFMLYCFFQFNSILLVN